MCTTEGASGFLYADPSTLRLRSAQSGSGHCAPPYADSPFYADIHTNASPHVNSPARADIHANDRADAHRHPGTDPAEASSLREEEPRSVGLPLTREELAAWLTLDLSPTPQGIFPGVWTRAEISERPDPEGSTACYLVRDGDTFVGFPYRDDIALVLRMGDRLVLLCGRCHAGLLNTLAHVLRFFERPIVAIVGGLHLPSATTDYLQRGSDVLVGMESVQCVYPNHCTGEAAFVTLTLTLGRPSCASARQGLFWSSEYD